jgi:hypothetical protein
MLIFAVGTEDDRHDVEESLGVRFERHDSLYLGGDYWLAHLPGSSVELRLRSNLDLLWSAGDPDNERFAYKEYADHRLLLEVDRASPAILNQLLRLPSLKLLSPAPETEGTG